MALTTSGHQYPTQSISVDPFPADFGSLFPAPPGLIENDWPPTQVTYLGIYLGVLGCRTIVTESHYIDRDFIHDAALFYARSLRSYPNFCQRVHFFSAEFDADKWRELITSVTDRAQRAKLLQESYLGFCVIRPLSGAPIGRTVLSTLGGINAEGLGRAFGAVRDYMVHLAGFQLNVKGLAFQQQDQGVSACATTALWSALQKVSESEHLAIPTPAQITEGASRYMLADGRALPSEGLNIQQLCEACRASGLEPLVIRSVNLAQARAQLLGYLDSELAPVLAIQPVDGSDGHAICGVGLKLEAVVPPADPNLNYRDASTAVRGLYVHDDRLGPYAYAELGSWTLKDGTIGASLRIQWPDKAPAEDSILRAIIVPLPAKLRMPISRIRYLGMRLAEAVGDAFSEFSRDITFNCRYRLGVAYQDMAVGFGLTSDGLYSLNCETVLSRYIGVIEMTLTKGPLFDVLLDATETRANPSVLAFVRRSEFPERHKKSFHLIAKNCGAKVIW
ncbi:MAG TPA: hypothetical protein VJM08_15200 [Anaerolineales bacterium]|nr:hypothetical protein [Anaerolineales bacterium]